ncbi:hypothetical protein S40288_10099 [Stachybotrys chartarum IBT 40288]|nr:hypothetical protein S40288_10099 [Stachybotrys chartarum IBT 40288]
MVLQLLAVTHMIDGSLDLEPHHELYQTTGRLFPFILSADTAIIYVFTVLYSPPRELGAVVIFLLILQLVIAGMIVILTNELFQKGYSLGSGISLFVAIDIWNIMYEDLSPITINTGRGPGLEGAVMALFHLLITWHNTQRAVQEVSYRQNLLKIMDLLATITIILEYRANANPVFLFSASYLRWR